MRVTFVAPSQVLDTDHGPGDCGMVERPILRTNAAIPPFWNPASESRMIGFIHYNGIGDGAAGSDACYICFQVRRAANDRVP